MTEFVWCDKVNQFRNYLVCMKEECKHLQEGPTCDFENAESARVRLAAEKVLEKKMLYKDGEEVK